MFDQLALGVVRYGNDGDYVTHQNTKKANYGTRIASQYEGHKASALNIFLLPKSNYNDYGSSKPSSPSSLILHKAKMNGLVWW